MNMNNLLVNRELATTFAECGFLEVVLAKYKKERIVFFKKHGSTEGENRALRRMTYVR